MSNIQLAPIASAMISHQGMKRQTNDDKVFASEELNLWILSDGVGGLKQGDQASEYTVNQVSKSIAKGDKLVTAIHSAHSVIKAYNKHEEEDRGATAVALHSIGDRFDVAWVGDSRAYLWNKHSNELTQLTEDHTLVQKLVNAGLLEPSEVKNHPKKHVITQCLGIENDHQLHIGLIQRDWQFGDVVLLASDGLYDEVSNEQMKKALNMPRDFQGKVEYLLELACQNGGSDNISLMLIGSPLAAKRVVKKQSLLSSIKSIFIKNN